MGLTWKLLGPRVLCMAPTPLAQALFSKPKSGRRLAEQLGVDESQVSRWRNGKHRPMARQRQAIADALGCKVEELWPS
jgi:transcriptional regulator with XRE-family HTH domain